MRIGIVSYDYSPSIGGLGIVAKQTRRAMERLFPSDVTIVISPSLDTDDRVLGLAGWWWKKPGGCPMFSLLLSLCLDHLVKKHRLDLLHVHAGSGGVFLLRKPSCSLVVTSHHTYLQEAKFVFMKQPIKKMWKSCMAVFERRTYQLADAIVCVSHDTAECLRKEYRVPAKKITVIENGIAEPSRQYAVSKDPATVLFIGRLEERKGVWLLLEAFANLKTTHPSASLRLVGRNLIGKRLDAFIGKKGLSHSVTQTGFAFDPLMRRELAHATMLVVPSLLEGFGLIAAEAMMAGTCVIVSDSAGLRSIVKDGETGLVFRSGDVEDCARVIARALDDSALRLRLGANAKTEASKRFHFDDRTRDLHRLLEEVLQRREN